jgi:hypothetical protein
MASTTLVAILTPEDSGFEPLPSELASLAAAPFPEDTGFTVIRPS